MSTALFMLRGMDKATHLATFHCISPGRRLYSRMAADLASAIWPSSEASPMLSMLMSGPYDIIIFAQKGKGERGAELSVEDGESMG